MIISSSEKRTLLSIAGCAIAERVDPAENSSPVKHNLTEVLKSNCGAFVSLYVDQHLRGCIGTFSEEEPLHRNVSRMAVSAAISDSRFDAVRQEELGRLEIEISILTPRLQVYDPSEIILGRHGIYMKHGASRGTLLPQVAIAQQWSVKEFLGNCSKYKAGIGWDGWKTAELYTYEAIVFRSDQIA